MIYIILYILYLILGFMYATYSMKVLGGKWTAGEFTATWFMFPLAIIIGYIERHIKKYTK